MFILQDILTPLTNNFHQVNLVIYAADGLFMLCYQLLSLSLVLYHQIFFAVCRPFSVLI